MGVSAGQANCRKDVLLVFGDDDSNGVDLVNAGIRAVECSRIGVEANFSLDFFA